MARGVRRESPRHSTVVAAWALWVLGLASFVAAHVFNVLNSGVVPIFAVGTAVAVGLMTIGAIVASRRRRNPIGWLFLVASVLLAFAALGQQYGAFALVTTRASWPGGLIGGWLAKILTALAFDGLLTLPLLLFPEGRLVSRAWRPVVFLAVGTCALNAVENALAPTRLFLAGNLDYMNPLGIGLPLLFQILIGAHFALVFVTVALAIASLGLRFRRANVIERQQLKWFVYGACFTVATLACIAVLMSVLAPVPVVVIGSLFPLSFGGLLVGTAMGILRYRLYDVDLVINRTLVYGLLTGVLAGLYTAIVALAQRVFVASTGQQSDIAVVVAIFVVAGTFTPLRNALQAVVDKRFKPARHEQAAAAADVLERMRALDVLRDEGMISTAEFDSKRSELLARL